MGDRTQLDFDFADDRALRLASEEFGEPDMWREPWSAQWPEVSPDQVTGVGRNGELVTSRERIASAGGVFIGTHQEGVEYGPMRFVGFEGELHEHPCSTDYWLAVELPDAAWTDVFQGRLSVLLNHSNRIYRYLEIERRAADYLRKTSVYDFDYLRDGSEFRDPVECVEDFPGDEPFGV